MKKKLMAAVAAALACSMVLAGCTSSTTSAPAAEAESAPAAEAAEEAAPAASGSAASLRFATGGTSGTYYAYGGVLANVLNSKLTQSQITVQSTGASKANIFLIDDGEADIAVVQNDVMDYAMNGTDLFEEDGAVTSFKTVAALYSEVIQIVASPDITSIEDLKGKRVSVGDAGSGTEFNTRQILAAYGISFDDIQVNNLGFGDSADALKDGKIDAAFVTAGPPTTAITELCTTNEVNLLSIDDEHAAKLIEEHPFYAQYTIPAGMYKGIDEDVSAVTVKATLIASDKISDDVIYELVKTIFESKDDITAAHEKGRELDTAYAVEGISVPFHPGAEKYFKEIGAIQ